MNNNNYIITTLLNAIAIIEDETTKNGIELELIDFIAELTTEDLQDIEI